MNSNLLGLNRFLRFEEREEIERELNISFADMFATLDDLQQEVQTFEKLLSRIFEGAYLDSIR